MDRLNPPKALSFEGNVIENWKRWKQNFGFYLVATEYEEKSDQIKAALFLHCIGDEGRRIYNTLPFDAAGDNEVYTKVIEKFEAHISPRKTITFNRYKFFTYRQDDGQTFDDYLTTMRKLCGDSELGTMEDELLRDMLIIGLKDKRLQEHLLSRENDQNTLPNVIKTAQTAELTTHQAKYIQKKSSSDVNVNVDLVGKGKRTSYNTKYEQAGSKDFARKSKAVNKIQNCKFCAFSHDRGACPAFSKSCNICHKKGHFSSCCKANKSKSKQTVREVKLKKVVDDQCETLFIGAIANDCDSCDEWTIDLVTNGSNVTYKIDTGAQANILPYSHFLRLSRRPNLTDSRIKLHAYNDTNIPVKGSCTLHVNYRNESVPVRFMVADINSSPILGLRTSTRLDLIRRIAAINKKSGIPTYLNRYLHCFGPLGCFEQKHKIIVDPNVSPTVNPPRRVPISILGKLKDELDRMVSMQVIVPVEEPTDWVNSLVIVEKPDKTIRVCLDPRDLNVAIKRPHFMQPTTEDVLSKLSTGKKFTKLDASCAYWQIALDDSSSKLLTFNTPFGRYRYLRMAYGVSSASDICQMYISRMLEGIVGATNNQDDIIIWGENDEQLKERTIEVFKAVDRNGMKLNKSKCSFHQSELHFLGHIVSSDGIRPDDKKIVAIRNMPYPTNVKELQRFLGSINYLGKFIPNLSDHTDPLRKLLEKNSLWNFTPNHKLLIDKLKMLITKSPVLKFFDPNISTRMSCDASNTGLGAILEQKHGEDWYPVAYASRSLTSSERNYCQLEKETLSIVFGCSRFHEYVYGRFFEVYNDHLPLKPIFNKPISKSPPRIQRFLLRLQRYEFKMHYIKGTDLVVADNLSRAALKDAEPEISDEDLRSYERTYV